MIILVKNSVIQCNIIIINRCVVTEFSTINIKSLKTKNSTHRARALLIVAITTIDTRRVSVGAGARGGVLFSFRSLRHPRCNEVGVNLQRRVRGLLRQDAAEVGEREGLRRAERCAIGRAQLHLRLPL